MSASMTVLLVDPDVRARELLAKQLAPVSPEIVQAADGATALALLASVDVRVVVSELYLPTGTHACLVQAIRADRAFHRTHVVAHTHRCLAEDREWAMHAGADAFLIKPTRAERMRYVVNRVSHVRVSGTPATSPPQQIGRRDTLEAALAQVESGALRDTTCIVFGRRWWQALTKTQQSAYRKRARAARVSLRSDSLMKNHFVEVRGPVRENVGLSSEQPESPYRRH